MLLELSHVTWVESCYLSWVTLLELSHVTWVMLFESCYLSWVMLLELGHVTWVESCYLSWVMLLEFGHITWVMLLESCYLCWVVLLESCYLSRVTWVMLLELSHVTWVGLLELSHVTWVESRYLSYVIWVMLLELSDVTWVTKCLLWTPLCISYKDILHTALFGFGFPRDLSAMVGSAVTANCCRALWGNLCGRYVRLLPPPLSDASVTGLPSVCSLCAKRGVCKWPNSAKYHSYKTGQRTQWDVQAVLQSQSLPKELM